MFVRILRKIGVFALAYLLAVALLAAASALAFHFVVANPDKVKNIVTSSGVYDNFVGVALDLFKSQGDDSGSTIPLADPQIQKIAKQAFSPAVLQTNSEAFIDGTYNWLDGRTAKPQFSLDFSGSKNRLAIGIGDYAAKRLRSLPPCSYAQIPRQIEVFKLRCLPPFVNVSQIRKQVIAELKSDKNFLPNPKVTPKSLGWEKNGSQFSPQSSLPKQFGLAKKALWLLLPLVAVLAAGLVFLHESRQKGVQRLGKSLVATGIFIAVSPLLFKIFYPRIASIGLSNNEMFNKLALPVMTEFNNAVAAIYYAFGGVSIALGIGAFILAHKYLK